VLDIRELEPGLGQVARLVAGPFVKLVEGIGTAASSVFCLRS